jgi:predicted AAA+ superfamily ATPase
MVFKRKVYDKLLEWKKLSAGASAVLLEGARRIGKSTIVEEFAKNEILAKGIAEIAQRFDDLVK